VPLRPRCQAGLAGHRGPETGLRRGVRQGSPSPHSLLVLDMNDRSPATRVGPTVPYHAHPNAEKSVVEPATRRAAHAAVVPDTSRRKVPYRVHENPLKIDVSLPPIRIFAATRVAVLSGHESLSCLDTSRRCVPDQNPQNSSKISWLVTYTNKKCMNRTTGEILARRLRCFATTLAFRHAQTRVESRGGNFYKSRGYPFFGKKGSYACPAAAKRRSGRLTPPVGSRRQSLTGNFH
jgi:hypothetical protein